MDNPALSPHVQAQALDHAFDGADIPTIARRLGITTRLIWSARKRDAEFDAALEDALQCAANDKLDETFNSVVSKVCNEEITANTAGVIFAGLRMWLEKRHPLRFSPKQQIDVTHSVTLIPLIVAAKERERQLIDATVIEADFQSLDAPRIEAAAPAELSKSEAPGVGGAGAKKCG